MMSNKTYWNDRDKARFEYIRQNLADDKAFNASLEKYYQRTIDAINKDIQSELQSFATRDGVSLAEARKKVSKADIRQFETEAKKVVKEADKMRKKGKRVSYSDFSDEVNERMRLYNVTMRINRLEYLKSIIGVRLIELGVDINAELNVKLDEDTRKEFERQSGILAGAGMADGMNWWTEENVQKIIMSSTRSANFSTRIWSNVDVLKSELEKQLSRVLISGENPKATAKEFYKHMVKSVGNMRAAAERIARTESARCQTQATLESFKEYDVKYCRWIAEPRACVVCKEIASRSSGYGEGVYPVKDVPALPQHPNCRCALSAHWADEDKQNAAKPDKADKMNIFNDRLSRAFESKFGNKDAQTIITDINNIISKAPKNIKRMFEKHSSKFDVTFGRNSYYSPREDRVSLIKDGLNFENADDYYQKKYDVFFHEFGHFIDGHGLGRRFYDLPSQDLSYYIDDDIEKLISDRIDKVELKQEGSPTNGYTRINGINYRLKKNGDLTKAAENKLAKYKRKQALQMAVNEVRDKYSNRQSYCDFSDIIGGAKMLDTTYPLGVGHPEAYWNQTMRSAEFFAEATSATINNPESLEILKASFPKAYAQYEKIVEEIANYED